MIRLLRLTTILLFFASSYSFSQEIDPSLLDNLTPEQIEIAKTKLNSGEVEENPKPAVTESTILNDNNEDINEIGINKKYGYGYFASVPTSITAVGDLPLPNDYVISLKDQFKVILSGSIEKIFDLDVNLDGTVLFPELGSINVAGKTFTEVKQTMKSLIEQSYIGVRIDLSLKNLSAKKITIVGAVKNPGTYLVNPFSTISSSLAYSGGVSEIGTLRNIRLIRNNKDIFSFDLYELLIFGNRTNDIIIEAGDVIVVDPAKNFISLTGQVKRPAIYEVLDDETLDDLISFGLGFTNIANKTNINLGILDLGIGTVTNISTDILDMSLDDVLFVNVNKYVNKNIATIEVRGAVKEPGYYNMSENSTLEELINNVDFIDVYPWLAVLEQFDSSKLERTIKLFSLNDKDSYKSFKLLPNSRVYFANINSIDFDAFSGDSIESFDISDLSKSIVKEYSLTINHNNKEYIIPIAGNFNVDSIVKFLGLDMSTVSSTATYISPLDNKVMTDQYQNMNFISNKFQTISFRSPVNDLITVSISGAVEYPGLYTLESFSTLEDLYKLIGDFKPEAFTDGAIFTRESIRQRQLQAIEQSKERLKLAILEISKESNLSEMSIYQSLAETNVEPEYIGRIAGDFSPSSNSSNKTILYDGDAIIIPKNPNYISVLGEVLNPSAFEFKKGINIASAIENAGGFHDYADKSKIYVIKANGTIQKGTRNIFIKQINLEVGDTIVVPRKMVTNSTLRDFLLPVTQVISDIAFAAAAVESLSNN